MAKTDATTVVRAFEAIREDWNEYRLEDGTIVRAKLVVRRMTQQVDAQGHPLMSESGEPLVGVNTTVVVTALAPPQAPEIAASDRTH